MNVVKQIILDAKKEKLSISPLLEIENLEKVGVQQKKKIELMKDILFLPFFLFRVLIWLFSRLEKVIDYSEINLQKITKNLEKQLKSIGGTFPFFPFFPISFRSC
jgi:flagellar biosynthesis protein FlhB